MMRAFPTLHRTAPTRMITVTSDWYPTKTTRQLMICRESKLDPGLDNPPMEMRVGRPNAAIRPSCVDPTTLLRARSMATIIHKGACM